MTTWHRSITWVLAIGTLFLCVGCGVRKPREDAASYRERLRKTEHVTTTYDARSETTFFTYKHPVSSFSLAIWVYEDSCYYDLRFLGQEVVCIEDGTISCWWRHEAAGQRISGKGHLEFNGEDRLRIKSKIIMVDGHQGPIIEVRMDQYDREDWQLVATLARDEAGRYWLFLEGDMRWVRWSEIAVDSHVK
jgi:hypothetical protein